MSCNGDEAAPRRKRRTISDEARRLNLRAFLALQGSSLSPTDDITALLRSDEPIDRLVRDRLIALLQAADGMSLKLTGHNSERNKVRASASRYDWYRIGKSIEAEIANELSRSAAIRKVASALTESEKKADKSLDYYRSVKLWIEASLMTDLGAKLGPDMLKQLYIFYDCDAGLATQLNSHLFKSLPPIGPLTE